MLTEREPLLGGVVLIGNLEGLGDRQTVENDVIADNAEVANGVLDGVNDLLIRGPVILRESLLAGGNDLLSDGLTEGDEQWHEEIPNRDLQQLPLPREQSYQPIINTIIITIY